jgi:hypothetical protein
MKHKQGSITIRINKRIIAQMNDDNINKFKLKQVEPGRVGCRRSVRLKTASDITRLLGKTINEALRGELDTETARTVGYLSSVMIKCIEVSDVQKRLEILERATDNQRKEKDQ